ncbi:nucleotide exchange factor GrpE [bacterium]|nr:MAG: nucleotide exchange factor GrpE [bacterium]
MNTDLEDNLNTQDEIDDATADVTEAAGDTDTLARQVAELKEEAATNLSGWQRSQADFENYKKREEAKQAEILAFAKEVTIVKLLPTLDALEQGLRHAPEGVDEKWLQGIEGTLQKLDKVLLEMGVQKIEAVGKQFDPNFHEAVREVPGEEDGKVMEELQTGYEINGKVIRPSQVVISKKQ